ncbi:MAG TPA: S41 family peptidase [Acidimicrobiia bacterium]|nr:S41 family peptidase [Acidimicrobiia bacterium]
MTRKSMLAALVALTMVAGCSNDEGAPSTTSAPAASTSSTDAASATTTTPPASDDDVGTDRPLDVVACDDASEEIVIVCEAYDLIETHYVDEVEDSALLEGAVTALRALDGADSDKALVCAPPTDGFAEACQTATVAADDGAEAAAAMVTGFAAYALDPNSAYLDEQSLALLREEQEGEIEGIGALVSPEDETIPGDNKQCSVVSETCRILIVSTIAGAPAEAAGLMSDDVLVAVNGEPIMGWTVDEVTAQVRGPAGTAVDLTLERDGEPYQVTITRAAVVIPLVVHETFGDVGYVALNAFTGNADAQFEEAVVDLLGEGVDHLVFDLRNNPGGFLTTAIEVTSVFLDEGDVVKTEGPEETTTYPVDGDAIVPEDLEVTVVVNRGSASASEVVAAALQERDRVTVVGENTFGKNTVQQRFSLSNGGALKLTIARWLTPGGHDFGGTGVTPDVELEVNSLSPQALVDAVTAT